MGFESHGSWLLGVVFDFKTRKVPEKYESRKKEESHNVQGRKWLKQECQDRNLKTTDRMEQWC